MIRLPHYTPSQYFRSDHVDMDVFFPKGVIWCCGEITITETRIVYKLYQITLIN